MTDDAIQIGRYRLLSKLAVGGMAELFLAREVGLGGFERLVVVKRILPHLIDTPRFVEMFLREARLNARINHPNVVNILELGEDGGVYYIAMEYIHGTTLRELLLLANDAETPLPLPAALSIILQACRGAHAAHELKAPDGAFLGLVHRDISPHNLMSTDDGIVKLLDFGIAKATVAGSEATYSGSVKGKFAYMSPEQCKGRELDRRSDVFALGAVLWELLVGVALFKRPTELDTLSAVSVEPTPSIADLRPDLPAEHLDAILKRATAKQPEDRYPSAEVFAGAINDLATDYAIDLSPAAVSHFIESLAGERLAERRELIGVAKERPLTVDERSILTHRTGITDVTSALGATRAERPAKRSTLTAPTAPTPRQRKRALTFWIGFGLLGTILLAIVVAAISKEYIAPQVESAQPPIATLKLTGDPLPFGWAPTVDPNVLRGEAAIFQKYFESELEQPVPMVMASDYADLADKVVSGEVAFAAMPPLLFLRTQAKNPELSIIAVKEFDGAIGSDGYLLTLHSSSASSLADLQGKRFCFTDPNSTTGYFLPTMLIKKSGYAPERFVSSIHWSGDHIQVLRDLIDKKCDAAATYSGALQVGDELGVPVGRARVLAITGFVPQDLIVASPKIEPAVRNRFKHILLKYDPPKHSGVPKVGKTQRCTGFSDLTPSSLATLKALVESERTPKEATDEEATDEVEQREDAPGATPTPPPTENRTRSDPD